MLAVIIYEPSLHMIFAWWPPWDAWYLKHADSVSRLATCDDWVGVLTSKVTTWCQSVVSSSCQPVQVHFPGWPTVWGDFRSRALWNTKEKTQRPGDVKWKSAWSRWSRAWADEIREFGSDVETDESLCYAVFKSWWKEELIKNDATMLKSWRKRGSRLYEKDDTSS